MPTNTEFIIIIAVAGLANFITRALPFILFTKNAPPKWIVFLGTYFAPMIITILIFYTLKNSNFIQIDGYLQIIAIIFTIIIHFVFNNYLVSVFGGTFFYMFLLYLNI